MALVIGFKIDSRSGAMICDEEDWILRRRRIFYGNFISPLVSREISDNVHVEALYGGLGMPSFTCDVKDSVIKKIEHKYSEYKTGKGRPLSSADDMAYMLLEAIQEQFKKRINLKLLSLYGFEKDDLLQGYFNYKGTHIEIKQEELKKKAMEHATVPEKGCLEDDYLEHKALLMATDKDNGKVLYGYEHNNPTLYLTAGPFEIRGTGEDEKDAAQLSIADFINRKPLHVRRKGFDRIEVITELIRAMYEASVHNQEVGGYFNLFYLDGRGNSQDERLKEPSDEAMKIATEIIAGEKYGELQTHDVYEMINSLVFEDINPDIIEEEMYRKAKSPYRLDFILRGYKADAVPDVKEPYMSLTGGGK